MRFFDTRRIIDSNRGPLTDLYEGRASLRATQELRTWHLPPLFDLSASDRAQVRAVQEKALLHDPIPEAISVCKTCDALRPIYGVQQQCLNCWDTALRAAWVPGAGSAHAAQVATAFTLPLDRIHLVGSLADFISWAHAILKPLQQHTLQETEVWSSPKKNFMAAEVGCTHKGCNARLQPDWLYSADATNWAEGLCPEHTRSTSYPAHYIWGMHPACYQEWQSSYSDDIKLHRTAQRYGAIALLLVSAEYHWVKLLSQLLPVLPKQPSTGIVTNYIGTVHRRPKHV